MYAHFQNLLNAIKHFTIEELPQRQPALVSLIAEVVNHETMDGELTVAAGNTGLERMDYWQSLKSIMRDLEFSFLGNGHFSGAWSHPLLPGKVIKVGFKKEDSGAAYTAFCRMHQGQDGIPNIYDVQRHAGCYTVVMDALRGFDGDEDDDRNHHCVAYGIIECGSSEAYREEYTDSVSEGFFKSCDDIREFFHGIASFDMHRGNIMFHPVTGKAFITDPVSFSHDREKTFSIDPEELLKEIEAVNLEKLVERCKARHNRHHGAEFLKMRAKRNKDKHKRARAFDKIAKKRKFQAAIDRQLVINERAFAIREGETRLHEIWLENQHNAFMDIMRAAQDRHIADMQWRVAQGLNLKIDDVLQAQLRG